MHIFWARLASFGHLVLISDPLIVSKFHMKPMIPKIYTLVKGRDASAILTIFIKLPVVIKTFVLSILSGRFTQVLLYIIMGPSSLWYMLSFNVICLMHEEKDFEGLQNISAKADLDDLTWISHAKLCGLVPRRPCMKT